MNKSDNEKQSPVALITGGARRIGATIAQMLHSNGYNIVLHYRRSMSEAQTLVNRFNQERDNSAVAIPANLHQLEDIYQLAKAACKHWQRLDVLINNASSFYPTPVASATAEQWDDLLSSNLKAPFFITQAVADELRKQQGCIINIADIHAERPLKDHPIYCAAKAGNIMLTKSLARELAPHIRVNGIAPGAILWPEQNDAMDDAAKQDILHKIPLGRRGSAEDIADTVIFLVKQAPYITGQIITVDGGRSLCN